MLFIYKLHYCRNAISPVPFAVQMDWIRLDRIDLNWIVAVGMIG